MQDQWQDRLAVHDIMNRYALAIDQKDWDGLEHVFTESVTADFLSFGTPNVWQGPATGWIAQVRATIDGMDATQHVMSNHLYDLRATAAVGTTYVQARHICNTARGDSTYIIGGHYEVTMSNLGGAWRIAQYKLVCTWHEGNRSVLAAAVKRAADPLAFL
jgi:hypothetical protein